MIFLVVAAGEAGNAEPVVLSQIDLDTMMRSKAAMYAILVTVLPHEESPLQADNG